MAGLVKLTKIDLTRRNLIISGVAGLGLSANAISENVNLIPRRGGKIRVALQSSSTSDTLDPAKGSLSTDYVRHYMLYNGLTKIGADLRAKPSLAHSIESKDLTTWFIKLKSGIRFHDGSELTSSDVVWSLSRHSNPKLGSKMANITKQFQSVVADGKYGVILKLTGPNADIAAILAQSHFLIIKNGEEAPKGNGTGPFKLAEFKPGVRTVVTRNNEYWTNKGPYLDEIELIAIPDEVSRVNALLSGDVHLIIAVNPRSTKRIRANNKYNFMSTPSPLYTDLILKQNSLPTNNPDFVAAIKHLVDRELIKRAVFRNFATIGNDHPIPPFHPYFNNNIAQTQLDLDRSRWHLKKSGFSGVRLPMYATPAAEGSVDMASILQEYGAQIGLNLAVSRVPSDGYWSTHWMKHPITFGNINPRPTADLIFSLFFKSDADWNESGWKNERFDKLLLMGRAEKNEAVRKEIYGEMQQITHDKCGVIIPTFINQIDGFDNRIKGLEPISMGGLMGYQFSEFIWWAG